MKKLFAFLCFIVVLYSCDKKSEVEQKVEEVPVEIKVHRFDKAFFDAKPSDLPELKLEYPFFFPPGVDDNVWIEKMQDPLWKEVHAEVEKQYNDFAPRTEKIEALFKHIKYYFPATKVPAVYTIIGNMDYNTKVLYAKDTLIISLELYLGEKHKYYADSFDGYIRQNFTESQMMPDIVRAWSRDKIAPPDNTFLGQMIYAGKQLYLQDLVLPDASDADKIGYTPEQLKWSQEAEGYIWSYFIGSEMLYSTDQKLSERFLTPAPFSKFYLEIDNESPGRVGAFIGWQIVRAYMENNSKATVKDLLRTDSRRIFETSRYKPKKYE